MTDDGIKAFDALLDKTVRAPRLSGSKVKELTESALRQVAHDHDLVAALLKLNASLAPASAQRISSLYVFDAIARAAKSAAKGSSGGATTTERGHGTPASLLVKMEGAVGSLVEGMVDDGRGGVWAEGRDKTRKVVEIWKKGSTFPEACVAQLAARIAAATTPAGRSPAVRSPSAGPSKHQQASGRSTTPTEPPPLHIIERYAAVAYGGGSGSGDSTGGAASTDAPAQSSSQLPPEIMAMLGVGKPEAPKPQPSESNAALDAVLANVRKAGAPAPAAGGAQQSAANIAAAAAAPNLDPAQLAALASLGATLGATPQLPAAAPAPAPAQSQPQHSLPAPPANLPPRPSGPNGAAPSAQAYGRDRERRRSRSPDRWARRDSRDDRRHDTWDRSERDRVPPPRDYRDRDRDRDHREYRGDRDRDHERDRDFRDQRGGGRDHRGEREYDHRGGGGGGGGRTDGRGDGRDFRADARDGRPTSRDGRSTLPPRPDGLPPRPTPPGSTVPLPSTRRRSSPARGERPGSRDGARGAPMAMSGSSGGGGGGASLDTFNWTTFNPADGSSWASLGEAWRASTGREPDQMELMQYMMTQMAGGGGGGGGDGAGAGGAASMGSMGGMGGMGMGGMGIGMGAMGMGGMSGMGMGMGMNGGAGMGNYQ